MQTILAPTEHAIGQNGEGIGPRQQVSAPVRKRMANLVPWPRQEGAQFASPLGGFRLRPSQEGFSLQGEKPSLNAKIGFHPPTPSALPGGSGAVAQPLSHNRRSFDTEHAVWARVVTQTGGNTHRTHPTQSTLSHRHCQPSDAHKAPTRRRHNMPTSHEPIVTSAHADPFGTRCDAPSVLLSEVGARWRTPSPN